MSFYHPAVQFTLDNVMDYAKAGIVQGYDEVSKVCIKSISE
jgi:hypothetical protein